MIRDEMLRHLSERFNIGPGPRTYAEALDYQPGMRRRMAMACNRQGCNAYLLAERWATGAPTRKELRRHVKRELRTQFGGGVLAWFWLVYRIWQWVDFIWSTLDDAGREADEQGER